jgi:hypothetical protein
MDFRQLLADPKKALKKLRDRLTEAKDKAAPRRTAWEHIENDLLGGRSFLERWSSMICNNWRRLRRWWKMRAK